MSKMAAPQPRNAEPMSAEAKPPRQRNRERTLTELQLAMHRLQRAGKKVSIKGIAEEAKVTPALIHNRYPDFAEQVRTLTIKSTRAQRDEKHELLQREREKNRQLRALVDQQIKEFADLASVNEALRAENSLLKAMAEGKVLKGQFKRKTDQEQQ
jgi:AcrR family transcriptional regulator